MGLLGGLLGGSKKQKVTQSSTPWAEQQPFLLDLYRSAQNLPQKTDRNFSLVPESLHPATLDAMRRQQNLSRSGRPNILTRGERQLSDTARGQYLPGSQVTGPGRNFDPRMMAGVDQLNPIMDDNFQRAFQAASNQIIPGVQSQFAGAGRLNSGLAQQAQTQALGDAFAGLYDRERGRLFDTYNSERGLLGNLAERGFQRQHEGFQNERDRQIQAAGMAPGFAQSEYGLQQQKIQGLAGIGGQFDRRAQAQLQDRANRREASQNYPYERLGMQSGVIQGGFPGGSSQQQTSGGGGSPVAGILGGALTGYGLAPQIANTAFNAIGPGTGASSPLWALSGMNPFIGAGIGGLLGGLF